MASRFDILTGNIPSQNNKQNLQQTNQIGIEDIKEFLHRHPYKESQLTGNFLGHVIVDESDWNEARRIWKFYQERR